MFRLVRGFWFCLAMGACAVSSSCGSDSTGGGGTGGSQGGSAGAGPSASGGAATQGGAGGQGGESTSAGAGGQAGAAAGSGGEPTSAGAAGEAGVAAGSGGQPTSAGAGGEAGAAAGSGGEPTSAGAGGEAGAAAGSGGEPTSAGAGGEAGAAAGVPGGQCPVGQRAEQVAAAYLVNEHSLVMEICALQSGLPCYPGDQTCSDNMDWGSTMVVDAGCVQEDLALSSCLAESTADGYECVSGSPSGKVDVCVPETAASNLCWDRESRMFDMAKKICALQADLPCAAAATPCANAIHAESSQYGNVGCGALRERLLLCLADLTQYDFECSQAGGILAPAVKGGLQGPCGAAQADLSNCVCLSGAGGSGGMGGGGGAAGSTPLTGGAGGGAAGTGPCATTTCGGPYRCCPYIYQDTTGPVCVGNCVPNSQACPTPAC